MHSLHCFNTAAAWITARALSPLQLSTKILFLGELINNRITNYGTEDQLRKAGSSNSQWWEQFP